MLQLMQIALRNLLQQRKRSLLLGGAIAMVTALLVMLLGVSTAMRESMIQTASALMTGHINVGGFYKVSAGSVNPVVTQYKPILDIIEREVPELDYVSERVRGELTKVISDTASLEVALTGIDIENDPHFKAAIQVLDGDLGRLANGKAVLLFEQHAKRLGVQVGDQLTLSTTTARGARNTVDVEVGAIAKNAGFLSALSVFLPAADLRRLMLLDPGNTGVLQLYLKDLSAISAVQERLRERLQAAGYRVMDPDPRPFFFKFESVIREDWTGQKLDLTNWEEEMAFVIWILRTVDALVVLLTGVLLVIIVIGIMNTMWIAIRERTREIGTLRAIGMQRSRILQMFLFEAFLLGVLGTGAGALVGVAIGTVLNLVAVPLPAAAAEPMMSEYLRLSIHPRTIVFSMLSISVVCAIAALYPSYRATKLQPVTAMQQAGGVR